MKFFFRHKDDTTPRTQQGTHTISMTERDYRLHNDNNVALKFRLSEKTEQMIDEICTYLDTSASDFIRQVLFSHLYGRYDLLGLLERQFPVLDESRCTALTAPADESAGRSRNVADYKVWVPDIMKDDLASLAQNVGIPLSRYIRNVIVIHLTGQAAFAVTPIKRRSGNKK